MVNVISNILVLILSWRRSLSYGNQSIDYDRKLCHKNIKRLSDSGAILTSKSFLLFLLFHVFDEIRLVYEISWS